MHRRIQAARSKFQNGSDLLPRYGKLFHNFFNRHTVFKVFKDNRHRRTRTLENPRACLTQTPIEGFCFGGERTPKD